MKGWNVASKPSNTPMARGATWPRTTRPFSLASSMRFRILRHCSLSPVRCITEMERGRPAAFAISSRMSNSPSKRSAERAMSKSLTACTTPCSRPWNASAIPTSSRAADSDAGVALPSMARWLSVRPVENPNAPASSAWRSSRRMAAMSASVAACWATARSPITNTRKASWGICVPTSMSRGVFDRTSMYSENVRHPHLMPSARAEPGMSSTPSISEMSFS